MLGRRGGPGRPVECCTFLERQINHSWSGDPCYQWQLESTTDVRGAWEIPPIPARAIAWSWICILQLFFPYFSPYSDIQIPSSSFNFINILSTAIFWYWFELWSYLILIRYSIDICLWNILVSPWWRSHTLAQPWSLLQELIKAKTLKLDLWNPRSTPSSKRAERAALLEVEWQTAEAVCWCLLLLLLLIAGSEVCHVHSLIFVESWIIIIWFKRRTTRASAKAEAADRNALGAEPIMCHGCIIHQRLLN